MRALLVLVLLVGIRASPDPCAPHPNCQECVNDHPHACGWCSTPVVYKNGGPQGNHCGTLDGTHPYACYGVFSTEDCIRGFKCDASSGICKQAAPGEGLPYDDCAKNCTAPSPSPEGPSPSQKPASTYECNPSNKTCYVTQPGHGTSLEICKQQCGKPSPPSPVSPVSPQPAAKVYKCNRTSWHCEEAPPGQGDGSKEVCMGLCHPQPSHHPPASNFVCNFTNFQCIQVENKNGTSYDQCKALCIAQYYCDQSDATKPTCKVAPFPAPGVPLPDCLESCKPHNNTPSDLLGTWRGLQIGAGFKKGEWDVHFLDASVVISFAGTSLKGAVSYSGRSPNIVLKIHVTESSFPGVHPGDSLNAIYDFDGAAPEVRYLSFASGAPNKPAPKDFAEAKGEGFLDWTLWECQPLTGCKFNANKFVQANVRKQVPQVVRPSVNDSCSAEATCKECLGKPLCGWCSVEVVYKDGSVGKHCAGYGSGRTQFECHGVFRTDDCNDYLCVEPQGTCTPVPLGGGKEKSQCLEDCKPGPTPSGLVPSGGPNPSNIPIPSIPVAKVYQCDSTNKTCFEVPPGQGTSKEICEQGCGKAPTPSPMSPVPVSPQPSHPQAKTYECHANNFTCMKSEPGHGTSLEICLKICIRPSGPSPPPGPVPFVGGARGLQIDNEYHQGEFDLTIDEHANYKITLNNTLIQEGQIYFGKQIGTIVVTLKSGKTFTGYYTQSKGRDVTHTLIAFGKDGSDVPTGWDAPWIKGGANGNVWVWIQ